MVIYIQIHIYIYIYIHRHHTLQMNVYILSKESFEVKLPTTWTDEKAEVGRIREEKRREMMRKKIREEKASEDRRCRCAKR